MADERIEAEIIIKDSGSKEIAKFQSSLKLLLKTLSAAQTPIKTLQKGFKNLRMNVIAANQGLELLGRTLRAVSAPFRAVVNEGIDFTTQMSRVKSISQITALEFNALTEEAKRIGETTVFTATQAAQGMEELSRVGFDASQNIKIAADAMDLAAAQASDLADTSRLVGIAFKIFSEDGLDAKDIVDGMNKSIGSSAQNMSDYIEAFKFAAGVGKTFNQSFDEVNKTIALLADVGFRGTLAGTGFAQAISRLANPSKAARDILHDLNLTLEDVNPNTSKLSDIFVKLNKAGLTSTQALELFGDVAGRKFALVVEKINTLLPEYEKKLLKAKTAQESAADALDNLGGDLKLFDSALSGLQIAIFDDVESGLREAAQASTDFVKGITVFVKENQDLVRDIADDLFTVGDAIGSFVITSIRGLGNLLIGFGKLQDLLEDLGSWIGVIIGDIITDFTLIGTEIDQLIMNADRLITDFVNDTFKGIKDFVSDAIKAISGLVAQFKEDFEDIRKFVIAIPGKILNAFVDAFDDIKRLALDPLSGIAEFLADAFGALEEPLPDPEPIPEPVIDSIERYAKAIETLHDPDGEPGPDELGNTATRAGEALLSLADGLEIAFESAKRFEAGLSEAKETTQDTQKSVKTLQETAKKGFTFKGLGTVDILRDAIRFEDIKLPAMLTDFMDSVDGISESLGLEDIKLPTMLTDFMDSVGDFFGFTSPGIPAKKEKEDEEEKSLSGIAVGIGIEAVNILKNLLMQTESLQEVFKIINKPLIEILEPIGEALIPVAEFLAKVIRSLAPTIKRIANFISKIFTRIAPALEKFFAKLVPLIDRLVVALLPVIGAVVNALLPVIEATLPFIIELLETVMPLIEELLPELVVLVKVIAGIIITLMPVIKLLLATILLQVQIMVALVAGIMEAGRVTIAIMQSVFGFLRSSFNFIQPLILVISNGINQVVSLINNIIELVENLGGGAVGGFLGGVGGVIGGVVSGVGGVASEIGDALGFASGSQGLTQDQLLRFPGMEAGSGLIKAHVGEQVVPANQSGESVNTFVFNIQAIDPRSQAEELRQVIESLFLERKLRVS